MGSSGIRRRKPAHHVPKVSNRLSDASPPQIMWPESGSGFDASGFSPAGSAQKGWQLTQGLGRRSRWLVWVMLAWALSGIGFILVHLIVATFG